MARFLAILSLLIASVHSSTAVLPFASQEDCGDFFAGTLIVLGDVNDDGWVDFATSDSQRTSKYCEEGWVVAISGRSRQPLWSQFGGRKHEHFGEHLASTTDRDGDGLADLLVYHRSSQETHLLSSKTGSRLDILQGGREAAGIPSAAGGQRDFLGDDESEIALIPGDAAAPPSMLRLKFRPSGLDRQAWLTLEDPRGQALGAREVFSCASDEAPPDYFLGTIGDVNGDMHADAYFSVDHDFHAELKRATSKRSSLKGIRAKTGRCYASASRRPPRSLAPYSTRTISMRSGEGL